MKECTMIVLIGLLALSGVQAQNSPTFPEPPRDRGGNILVPSRGSLVDADDISTGICMGAQNSNVKTDELYAIEESIFYHAMTSENDPNRNQKVQEWWSQAMPYINCYDRVYDGFEGGSPLNLMAYKGYGAQIIYLMRKYELSPEMMVYDDPRTGLNLIDWMEERIEDPQYPSAITSRINDELRLLTRWFTRIGYFE